VAFPKAVTTTTTLNNTNITINPRLSELPEDPDYHDYTHGGSGLDCGDYIILLLVRWKSDMEQLLNLFQTSRAVDYMKWSVDKRYNDAKNTTELAMKMPACAIYLPGADLTLSECMHRIFYRWIQQLRLIAEELEMVRTSTELWFIRQDLEDWQMEPKLSLADFMSGQNKWSCKLRSPDGVSPWDYLPGDWPGAPPTEES